MSDKVIAILRGIQTNESGEIFGALIAAGISKIEVPLNSPNAFITIAKMLEKYGNICAIGAGTVTKKDEVLELKRIGAHFIVSPNCDEEVIKSAINCGLEPFPGTLSPTEMFNAIKWGAENLKLFPASVHGIQYFKAIKEVLPPDIALFAVGGIDAKNINDWLGAGVNGVGLGSSLYKAGDNLQTLNEKISSFGLNGFGAF